MIVFALSNTLQIEVKTGRWVFFDELVVLDIGIHIWSDGPRVPCILLTLSGVSATPELLYLQSVGMAIDK